MGVKNYLKNIGQAMMGRSENSASGRRSIQFRYHSGSNSKNRKSVMPDTRSEDSIYNEDYDIHSARVREQLRNYSVLTWMIDKHLDFVATFDIQFKTGSDALDDWLTELMDWWSKAENFDTGKRYSLYQYLRVNEAQKVMNGDCGTLKFADGRVKAIDSDQINHPYSSSEKNWFRGVRTNPVTGEATHYHVILRNTNGELTNNYLEVPADQFYLHAERKHYPNLLRGISPITSAINSIQDCYEGINWQLVQSKLAAMLAVVTKENGRNALPQMAIDPVTGEPTQVQKGAKYQIDVDGALNVSMEVGEDLEFKHNQNPSTETQAFYEVVTIIALKALGIPYSFFREDFTNFYGSRGGLLQYLRSCETARQGNIAFLNHHIKWRIVKWIIDGFIKLPQGYDVRQIRWQCVPRGFPWWDPAKEINGSILAIQAGLKTPQQVCLETGSNYYENIEAIKVATDWANKHGVTPNWIQAVEPLAETEDKDDAERTEHPRKKTR
jgi:capsid protein